MSRYRNVPWWWYAATTLIMLGIALGVGVFRLADHCGGVVRAAGDCEGRDECRYREECDHRVCGGVYAARTTDGDDAVQDVWVYHHIAGVVFLPGYEVGYVHHHTRHGFGY